MAGSSEQASSSPMSERFISDRLKCDVCGADNPAAHKFCGSCGAPLEPEGSSSDSATEASPRAIDAGPGNDAEPKLNSTPAVFEDSITNPSELTLFRSFRPASDDDGEEWESDPSRLRIYLGVFVLVVIIGLAYLSWQTSRVTSQRAHPLPAQPPVTSKDNTPAPSTPRSAQPANRSEQATPSANTESQRASAPERKPEKPAVNAPVAAPPSSPVSTIGDGGEELAMARHYLDGPGHDSGEAVKWLWKSIAKQNSEATLMLADLYLKGDGVSKNCEQARVLLDSAARKGVSGAGERIRNLQAFGCQ